jgi:prephenate dehydrogenase
VAILGLGLMGGSLALALRGRCARLIGIDPDPEALSLARQMSLVDDLSDQPAQLLPQAHLIILAAPVHAILALIQSLPELHPGCPVVLDLGSTKYQIVQALDGLPSRFDPMGGHPMCGKAQGGLPQADSELYHGAPFAFTPLPRTSPRARSLAGQLALVVGAHPVWLDPQTHDRWVAATSHLPFLAANALAAVVPTEARPLVGPGLRSATRLAPSPWGMMHDILETNRANVLAGLRAYRQQLLEIEELLAAEDFTALGELVAQGAQRCLALTGASTPPESRSS